jgi:hypothetical protein
MEAAVFILKGVLYGLVLEGVEEGLIEWNSSINEEGNE